MKFVFALAVCALVGLSSGRTLNSPAGLPRTHGNFGPQIKKSFQIKPEALFQPSFANNDPIAIATLYASLKTGVAPTSLRVTSSHKNARNGVTHVYLQQVINGVEVANGVANVNVAASGEVISVGSSFFTHAAPAADFKSAVKRSPSQAVNDLAKFLKIDSSFSDLRMSPAALSSVPSFKVFGASFAVAPISADLKYMQIGEGQAVTLVWSLQVEMKDNMYNAFVDAETGEVVSLIDWVSDATYNAYPLGISDPLSGERVLIKDPAVADASPLGWHSQGEGEDFTDTVGNNVYAQNNPDGGNDYLNNYRPDGSAALNFDFPVDFQTDPEDYVDAATTNLFYWNNIIHDLLYVYGFDEASGNFQQNNLDKGGKGADAVIAFAQDGSGTNNANFATPPDGQHGRMRMYVWTETNPRRDGDLDGGIVFHEYCHGLSTRLTGGPADSNCLGWGEQGGMGEGWGDFFATVTRMTEESTRADNYAMGDYPTNDPAGIRKYLYSTDMTVNPSTYIYLGETGYEGVHAKGSVWANMLYEMYWNLVDKNGFDPDWFNVNGQALKTDGTFLNLRNGQKQARSTKQQAGLGGNVIALQVVVDGMKLQPCNPSFTEARDAILQADELNNAGDNKCAIWQAFAKRGLGVDAKYEGTIFGWKGTEDFKVPAECDQA